MFAHSGLDEVLGKVLSIGDKHNVLCGQSGYNHRSYLEVPSDGVRITLELAFREVKMYWTSVYFKRKLRLRGKNKIKE